MRGNVFSESWYKIANLKVSLNSNSYIKKQLYRGEEWYVIEDSYNNQFFKIKPEAYQFLIRLDIKKTVEEVWVECLELFPDTTPSQDEVLSLLTSLHHKNLLYFKNRSDNEQLVDRNRKRKASEIKGKLFSFLYIKVPLFDPDNILDKSKGFIDIVFSKKAFIVWILTLLIAFKYVIENFSLISDQTQGVLAPSNLFLLYISIILLKTIHEFGHAMMVKKFGGRVNTMGVMILVFTPIPFMDATQSWLFRSKYERALVGAAGMIVELFIAAIATIIWANTGDGIIHSISFNIMIIGSISSIFFNGNPLLRFDSYFILSDMIEIPNLYERSKKQWYYIVEKYIFKLQGLVPVCSTKSEAWWMIIYAFLSFLYRIFVALVIAIFVADQWFLLGVLVVVISLYLWILKPFITFFKYLFSDIKLKKTRTRTLGISFSFLTLVIVFLFIIPFPYSIKANGIVLSNNYSGVFLETQGELESIKVKEGTYLKKGDLIAVFSNKDLDFEIENIKFSIKETKAYLIKARNNVKADVTPINEHLKLLNDKLVFLKDKKEKLKVRALSEGYFVYENISYLEGTWFNQGRKLGNIIPDKEVHFQAVVPQEKASELFKSDILQGSIKLYGLSEQTIETIKLKVIPFQKQELPSAALGWLGGGEMATSSEDSTGTKSSEGFFEVRADILKSDDILYLHGRSGVLKIKLDSLTLTQRLILNINQILQKHYKI